MEKLLLSVSLVFFMLNIDELYGPLRKQKLQHTCVLKLILDTRTWLRFKGHLCTFGRIDCGDLLQMF